MKLLVSGHDTTDPKVDVKEHKEHIAEHNGVDTRRFEIENYENRTETNYTSIGCQKCSDGHT